jgi:mycofactocin system FadH/OYE family oxidoreductase 1
VTEPAIDPGSSLVGPVRIGSAQAPSRVMFGPHETNLGAGRAFSERHVAYYARRARGGAGVIVTETASVSANDWPYERAPLASLAGPGWRSVAAACAPSGALVLAGLGHAGGQGSSAFSQEVMWAPSRVADVVSREPPADLDDDGIAEIVSAFGAAAAAAMDAGLAGVEIDAGAWSLLRQFHSGLTNLRDDRYGADRLLFTRSVLGAARRAVGSSGIVGLRLCCDELAPWAGVTPEHAAQAVAELAGLVDVLTVVRGGPFSTGAYRPDAHTPAGFNTDLCRRMREAAGGRARLVLQGSVVDPAMAAAAVETGVSDLVEMTRALIADADLVARVRAGDAASVRPCILCNQACRVRDNRNPIVSCVMDPSSGHETEESSPPADLRAEADEAPVLVVGGGPAGLECARVLAAAGRRVRVVDDGAEPGGMLLRSRSWMRSTRSSAPPTCPPARSSSSTRSATRWR